MDRRNFLKTAALSAAAFAADGLVPKGMAEMATPTSNAATLARRDYGKTGVKLSIIGFGGIVVMNAEQEHANRIVAEAVERGISYFDVAPGYGNAEEKLGPALGPYRKNVFLACKTGQRKRDDAEKEFKRSLERLRTDHFDLYQLHGIMDTKNDVDVAFGKGGVMELFMEAKKSGQVRFLGFSTHNDECALAALDRFDFDSVLFPMNYCTWFAGNYGHQTMQRGIEKGAARMAIKGLAQQPWPEKDPLRETYKKCWYKPIVDPQEAELALRWTLSQPITAAVTPGEEELFRRAVDIGLRFTPITKDEEARLKAMAEKLKPIFKT